MMTIHVHGLGPSPDPRRNRAAEPTGFGRFWQRAFVVWLLIIGAEVAHGALRVAVLAPRMTDMGARQFGVFTGSVIVLTIALITIRWIGAHHTLTLIQIGLFWALLTVAFDVAVGRLLFGYAWLRIVEDYDLRQGGFLGLGMVFMALSPLIAARVRGVALEGRVVR